MFNVFLSGGAGLKKETKKRKKKETLMPKPNSPISLTLVVSTFEHTQSSYILWCRKVCWTPTADFHLLLQYTIDCSHKIQLQEVSQTSFKLVFTYLPIGPLSLIFLSKEEIWLQLCFSFLWTFVCHTYIHYLRCMEGTWVLIQHGRYNFHIDRSHRFKCIDLL